MHEPMQRFASILAHVLASTAIVACGGSTADVPGQQATSPTGGGTSTSPTEPRAPSRDAGASDARSDANVPEADAGCTTAPALVRSGGCSDVWHHACGIPKDVKVEDGLTQEECNKVCGPKTTPPGLPPGTYWGCAQYLLDDLPGPSFECYTCVEGRRPDGYVDHLLAPTIAGWLAHAADLERVSIDAFQILRRELEHHGAPSEMTRRAQRAEADEVRHARILATLARREGATLSVAPVTHGPVRALVDIALENAVEGCIRETYGALVAGFQADHAARNDIRCVMKRIYRDETSHAELAWHVHAWIVEKLTAPERVRVEQAMEAALAELTLAASSPTGDALVEALGLPPRAQAQRLVDGLRVQRETLALAA